MTLSGLAKNSGESDGVRAVKMHPLEPSILYVFPHNNLLPSLSPVSRWKLRQRGVECWQDCRVSDRDRSHPRPDALTIQISIRAGLGAGRIGPRAAVPQVWTRCDCITWESPLEIPATAPGPRPLESAALGAAQQPVLHQSSRPCPYPQDGDEMT